jgi:PAS domain S-box-containing protein
MPQQNPPPQAGIRYDSMVFRALVAFVAAIVALLLRTVAGGLLQPQSCWLILLPGVVFSAWYGGLKPGLITTLALLPAGYFFNGPDNGLAAGLFAVTSIAICLAMQRLRVEHFQSQATSQRLHEVFESTQDAILSLDCDFRCLYANRRAGQIAKKEPAQLFGKSLRLIFPETPGATLYRELNRVARDRSAAHFREKTEIGSRWYEFDAYPTPDGFNLFVRDITDRKTAEADTDRRGLDSVLREMPIGVLLTSSDMRVKLINPAAEKLFGALLRAGDRIDLNRRGTLQTPEGARLEQSQWPTRLALETGVRVSNQELDYLRPDGTQFTLIVSAVPLTGADGNVEAVLGTYLDVTSLRRAQKALRVSEDRLRRLFDSPVIGVVSGEGDNLLEANAAWLNMLGYTREELESGTLSWRTLSPPDCEVADERAKRQMAGKGFCDPMEREFFAKDGRRVPVLLGATAYEENNWTRWIAWVLDLSERKKLESRLRDAAKLESIGLLAGGIAHDFNNILTSIMGNASLAFETVPSGHEARGWLQNTLLATERAADLTRQLLAYAGKGRFIVRPVNVSAVVGEIGQLIRSSIPRNVELNMELAPGLPAVDSDAAQLQQVLMNLVINAAEAAGGNHGAVHVATGAVNVTPEWLRDRHFDSELSPGVHVSITVRDNGEGMDSETLKRIFDPFFTTKFPGRGLGLAAATGIVRSHKGAIEVCSKLGEGSTFQVMLPASSGGVAAAEPVVQPAPPEGSGTILVVDDEEVVRTVAKSTLSRYGYTVLTAENGREALKIYRGMSHSISLVILDMTMPKMSGDETLANLRAIHSNAKILLSSGFEQDETTRYFGAAGFIQKPYTASALAAKVTEVLRETA